MLLTTTQGVKQIQRSHLSARYVFISPPAPELVTLESRLRGRGTEKEDSIQKRLAQAKLELEYAQTPGVHDCIIVNDDLEKAYKELEDFIFEGKGELKGNRSGGGKAEEQGVKDGAIPAVSVQN
jgi:guanylate kinase